MKHCIIFLYFRGTVICAWGEKGAMARTWDGQVAKSPSFPPDKVVDTLAAGDTFNAAVILALSHHRSLQDALTFGCKIAGAKCGMVAFDGLKDWMEENAEL